MGHPFERYPLRPTRYHPETWDFLFVPTSAETRTRILAWAEAQRGTPYDYFHAFTCPVLPTHAAFAPPGNNARQDNTHPARVFCSQAALHMLKAGGILPDRLQGLVPARCSPAALYRILTESIDDTENAVEVVNGWACAMAKQSFTKIANNANKANKASTRPLHQPPTLYSPLIPL
eukprot:1567238-Rhodomonas_salina.1